jgi:hypothetical protein
MRTLLLVLIALCLSASAALAQPRKQSAVRPSWAELTAEQQRVLDPLKADWDSLDRDRKMKWVGIAKRYPKLSVQEQERIQRRMQLWTKLTPEQRRQARETYKQLAKQPPQKQKGLRERWAEYQREQARPSPFPVSPAGQ